MVSVLPWLLVLVGMALMLLSSSRVLTTSRWIVIPIAVALVFLAGVVMPQGTARAHAEPETSIPAAGSTVEVAPLTLEITFSEEIASDGVAVRVVGPDGVEANSSTADVDLNDPERRRVTQSLKANLAPGRYTVEWETTSGVDDDTATGSFAFTVAGDSTAPAASPASIATPAGSSAAGGASAATPGGLAGATQPEPTIDPDANGNPLSASEGSYDGRAYALSVGAGLIGLAAIALFYRAVRPRDPIFGSRVRG